ncbi:MAG: cytochrome c family protein [Chloroflexi bacterium]|nr:cytochrome c family protein [Chloroflexota bacterium]
MIRPVTRYAYPVGLGLLLLSIALVGTFVVVTVLPELVRMTANPAVPAASPTAKPSPSSVMSPIGIGMPVDADCGACHLDATGVVGTKDIPTLAHPLEGWKDCTACHADDRLVQSAPGHSSLHKADCLTCHRVADAEGTAPPRPHHLVTGQSCVTCHGNQPSASGAPLPTDMAGRNNCWICHSGTEFAELFNEPAQSEPPPPTPEP